ncbi:MAG TPA: hypothetical protein VHZ30_00410 [Verrucomicrobiae bacterium]|nr:hypothetical protein [Verrucomicrobiae bacterium]
MRRDELFGAMEKKKPAEFAAKGAIRRFVKNRIVIIALFLVRTGWRRRGWAAANFGIDAQRRCDPGPIILFLAMATGAQAFFNVSENGRFAVFGDLGFGSNLYGHITASGFESDRHARGIDRGYDSHEIGSLPRGGRCIGGWFIGLRTGGKSRKRGGCQQNQRKLCN